MESVKMNSSAIITVTEYPAMRGRYLIRSTSQRDKRGVIRPADVSGAAGAAAKAMSYVMEINGSYCIFAPSDVLSLIPLNLRSR
jgi:hypothetical protein